MKKRLNQPITEATLDEICRLLPTKGLNPETVPAEFAELHSLQTRDLDSLTETQGQTLLTWLGELPDDQPAEAAVPAEPPADEPATDSPVETEPTEGAAPVEPETEGGNGHAQDDIRKADDSIWVKRALNAEERQNILDDLYDLESRRTEIESILEKLKSLVKANQKEIENIDTDTYRLIRDIRDNQVEGLVRALRITNHTTGMISWFDQYTGELLRELAIAAGAQLPLDLAGEADQPETEQADDNQPESQTAEGDHPEAIPAEDPPAPADTESTDTPPSAENENPPLAADPIPTDEPVDIAQ